MSDTEFDEEEEEDEGFEEGSSANPPRRPVFLTLFFWSPTHPTFFLDSLTTDEEYEYPEDEEEDLGDMDGSKGKAPMYGSGGGGGASEGGSGCPALMRSPSGAPVLARMVSYQVRH